MICFNFCVYFFFAFMSNLINVAAGLMKYLPVFYEFFMPKVL